MFPMLFFMVSCGIFNRKLRKPSNSRSSMRFAIESISVANCACGWSPFSKKLLRKAAPEFRVPQWAPPGAVFHVPGRRSFRALAEDKSASEKIDPKMEEMMKKAEAAGTPGSGHKALEPLVGNWTGEVKSWMAPDAPSVVTKATAK